jgi:hypothetical protein
MLPRVALAVGSLSLTVAGTATLVTSAGSSTDPGGLVVHEWGTFTTVAGVDGRAIDWLPLSGPTDLPCFVERFQNRRDVKLALGGAMPLDYAAARANLVAKVRMETPVLYFYAPRPTTATVSVRFPRGLMTEWYPRATLTQPIPDRTTLRNPATESLIEWRNVRILPNGDATFPTDAGESHYYAARETDAAPLVVGDQREKFLFYRGVASFDVPLSAVPLHDERVRVHNLGVDDIHGVVLFENRRGVIRYRTHDVLRRESVLALPSPARSVTDIRRDLQRLLVKAGLYEREAKAMVDSWRDSWFEEGTRVFYVVPRRAVDAILPLGVEPAPTRVQRVFVGRMEVITPAIEQAVENAAATNDAVMLARYGRFLGPVTDRILSRRPDTASALRLRAVTDTAFATLTRSVAACNGTGPPISQAPR